MAERQRETGNKLQEERRGERQNNLEKRYKRHKTKDGKSRETRMEQRNSRIYIIGYNDFNSMMVRT
jgi:hypothetical protein